MYTTGELASMSRVSQRMLRHYDKIGLLKPTEIGENGYRYYDDNAVVKIGRISQLRRYQLSLNAIKEVLDRDDNEFTGEVLKEQANYFRHNNLEQGGLILEIERQIRAMKSTDFLESLNKNYDILIGYRGDFIALCQRRTADELEIDDMADELFRCLESSDVLVQTGPHMTIFHDEYEEYDAAKADLEVCIQVNVECDAPEPFYTRVVKGGMYISTLFIGSYDMIGEAYCALMDWANAHDYRVCGNTIERYYKDVRDNPSQDSYITEVCMPVEDRRL